MKRMFYFDNAATSLHKPKQVIEAVTKAMETMGNSGRGAHSVSLEASGTIYDVRAKLADFLGAESPRQIAFTANSTESLNIAIKGVLEPGDHVITTVLEHNSVLRPIYEMERKGVEVTIIPCDEKGDVHVDDFQRAIRKNTKAIVSTHGSNLTGNLVDIDRLGELAREEGLLFIVDGSQTVGAREIDVKKSKVDILCFTGHKALMGPQGTGGLYVKEGLNVKPLLSGGSGVESFSKTHPTSMPTALEAGTLNGHGIAGLGAGVDFINDVGIKAIREKEKALMERFYRGVVAIPGIKVYGNFEASERCPIVSINLEDYDSAEVSDALYVDYGICTRAGAHCAPLMHEAMGTRDQGMVRFSFSYFNTTEEVDIALEALNSLKD